MAPTNAARFPLGQVVATPGALQQLEASGESATSYIRRHVSGDWGVLDAEDRATNEEAVAAGFRILSSYVLKNRSKLWIITEADRSSTCLLLPSEY